MDPALQKQITAVQNVLGKYVKKPPLAEKHLARPPFRFLHDILVAVMNGTGFYAGLFTPGELDSSALNTKEEKTEFLNKVISVTGLATGAKVDAKVSKILAGQDPEKTLELLIVLGTALDRGVSSKDAVATVMATTLSGGDKKKSEAKGSKSKEAPGGKVKDKDVTGVKKSSSQQVIKPSPAQVQHKQRQDKAAPNPKSSSNSKTKSPASKGVKADDSKTTRRSDEKRDRSGSRDESKSGVAQTQPLLRQDSKSIEKVTPKTEAPPPLTKLPSKEDLNRTNGSASRQHAAPSRDQSLTRTERVPASVQQETEVEEFEPEVLPVLPESTGQVPTKPEDDSMQFMGEVESLLQEHGIQIEAEEKRHKTAVDRKKSAVGGKSIAEKPMEQTSNQVKAAPIAADVSVEPKSSANVVVPPSNPPKPTSTPKLSHVTSDPPPPKLSHVTSDPPPKLPHVTSDPPPHKPTHSDESDVDTDDSEVGPLGNNAKRNVGPARNQKDQPQTGSSEAEPVRNAPPSAMRRPPSSFARPTSARPAPPRPKTAIVEEEAIFRPPTTKIPVILDSEDVDDDESSDSRKQGLLDLLAAQPIPNAGSVGGAIGSGDIIGGTDGRGHLVQQIMETKRELEAGDRSKDDDMGALHKQSQGELEALKGLIQTSARLANPLARILDFLQEDIDAMTSEYVKYKTEDKRLQDLLEKEKEITRQRLKPKRMELMELMDKLEQQNFEIRAAHNDLHEVEEHLQNYMTSIDAGPEQVDIPTRFMIKNDWEFDLELAGEEHDDLEKQVKGRRGAFGPLPPFLCVSAEVREAEKAGGRGFSIPKPKRKVQNQQYNGNAGFGRRELLKKPVFAIETNSDEGFESWSGGSTSFRQGQAKQRFGERRRSSQFLEPPEPELNSLEVLSEK